MATPTEGSEVPEGAAVFPLIPPELGVNPLLLTVLHAVVFLSASDDGIVNDAAADEALNYFATYLQRVTGPQKKRIEEDLDCLIRFARQEKWDKAEIESLQKFTSDFGVGELMDDEGEADA
jgi:hypothetical protein